MTINVSKFIGFLFLGIIGVYLITYFINKAIPQVPVVDYGIPLLTIIILLSGFIVYRYGVANHKLDKKDLVGLLVFMGITFVAVVYLPHWFPQWFSGDLALSKIVDATGLLKSTIGLP